VETILDCLEAAMDPKAALGQVRPAVPEWLRALKPAKPAPWFAPAKAA